MEVLNCLSLFKRLFSHQVWASAQLMVLGAILAPGKRTVSAILWVLGFSEARNYQSYHRVLNRAVWSSRKASHILLSHLLAVFAPSGPIVLGIDDTIERRRGKKITAKGIYRDPVRSSKGQLVKTSGLRWLSLQLLVPIPWAKRQWGLPFLTVLAPSERYHQQQGRRHKQLTDWARQMLKQVRRWQPQRPIVVVADGSFAATQLLLATAQLANPVQLIARLRLDAALYQPPPPRSEQPKGRPRKVGKRLPSLHAVIDNPDTIWHTVVLNDWYGHQAYRLEYTSETAVWYHSTRAPLPIRWMLIRDPNGKFETQALVCNQLQVDPVLMLKRFRWRWQLEVTFQEVRAHLGVETQRQWSEKAILRTTPALMALFSIVTVLAQQLQQQHPFQLPKAAWYQKKTPTFVDALALVRQHCWKLHTFQHSTPHGECVNVPKQLFDTWFHLLCYAA